MRVAHSQRSAISLFAAALISLSINFGYFASPAPPIVREDAMFAEVGRDAVEITTPIALKGGTFRGSLTLELVDPSGKTTAASTIPVALASGQSSPSVRVEWPQLLEENDWKERRDLIMWTRVRYRLTPAAAKDCSVAEITGVRALGPMMADLFGLRVVTPYAPSQEAPAYVRVFAENPFTGAPVSGVQIEVVLYPERDANENVRPARSVKASGVTGDDGGVSWQLMLPPVPAEERESEVEYKLRLAGTRGFVRVEEEREVDFHRRTDVIITTDKPLYQPGQTLHIRMLAYDPLSRRPRSIEPIGVQVADEESRAVFKRSLTSDRFGVASADWTIPGTVPLGTYSIEVTANDGDRLAQMDVRVSRYELPTFVTNVERDLPYYLPGQDSKVKVTARFVYGEPVRAGHVRVAREASRQWNFREQKWDVTEEDVWEGEADSEGSYTATIPLQAEHQSLNADKYDRYRDLEYVARYTEAASGRSEERRFRLRITQQALHLYAFSPEPRQPSGMPVRFYVIANYADGSPAVCDVSVAGRADSGGEPTFTAEARTDEHGLAFFEERLAKVSTDVKLNISGRDGKGVSGFFVTEESLPITEGEGVRIRTDRTLFHSSEPLRVDIESTIRNIPRLFVELVSGDSIVRTQTLELREHHAAIEFPPSRDLEGLVTIVAYAGGGPDEFVQDNDLFASRTVLYPVKRTLQVDARFDQKSVKPGEPVRAAFSSTAPDGKPRETSLGVVVYDVAVEERERTESESGQGRNYFDAYYSRFFNWHASLSDVTLRDLEELDESKPFPAHLALIGDALLQRAGGGYAYRLYADVVGGDRSRSTFSDELDPVEGTISHILDSQPTPQYPRDAATLFATLAKHGVQLDKMSDMWGNPYYAKFGVAYDKYTLNISSAGPDERRGTYDDFDLIEHSKPFFDPGWAEQVKKAVDGFKYREGRPPVNEGEVASELLANKSSFSSLRDPWNSPYRVVYEPSRSRPFYEAEVLSAGPDRKFDDKVRSDDVRVASFERNWFFDTEALISRALTKRNIATRTNPASEADFIAALRDEGIDFASLRDPWGQPIQVVFSESANYSDRAHVERVAATPTSPAIDKIRLEPVTQRLRQLVLKCSPKPLSALEKPAAFTLFTYTYVVSEESRADAAAEKETLLFSGESRPVRRARVSATGLAGTISGTVSDGNGAIIPGAKLTLTNTATAAVLSTTTNDEGAYVFVSVQPGTYSLRTEAMGFMTSVLTSIEVRLSVTTTINLTLTVASVSELVTVTAGAADIQTDAATVSSTVEVDGFIQQFWLRRDGAKAASTPRLRQDFPETLVWQPSLITDAQGQAQIEFKTADSITTWRMAVIASTEDGLIGSATADLRAFQPFFAEHQPPPSLTVGDEIETPIVVRNYQDRASDVMVKLVSAPWMQLLAGLEQPVSVEAKGAATALAPFRAITAGDFKQEASAIGAEDGDRVARPISVRFDGRDTWRTYADLFQRETTFDVTIPEDSIHGSEQVELKIYPDLFAHALEGIEGIVRRPYGCLEQTTSTGYANLMVLQYLKRTDRSIPAVESRASLHLADAVARISSFASADGGYFYFTGTQADTALTAHVLRFLTEAREFVMIEPAVIARTRQYLSRGQRADGLWETKHQERQPSSRETMQLTALVARAIAASEPVEAKSKSAASPQNQASQTGIALNRSLDWLDRATREIDDPYALGLYLLAARDAGRTGAVLEAARALQGLAKVEAGALFWDQQGNTPFYGWGRAGRLETTGLVVEALNAAATDSNPAERDGLERAARRGLLFIVNNKDQYGVWYSTQATVNVLRAVIAMASQSVSQPRNVKLAITVDGGESKELEIPADLGAPLSIELSTLFNESITRPGSHRVTLRADTAATLSAAIVARASVPWVEKDAARGVSEDGGLRLGVSYDRLIANQGEPINCAVHAERIGLSGNGMMLAEIGLPPGVDVDLASLRQAPVMKFDVTPDRIVLYLWPKAGGTQFTFTIRPRLRIKAAAQPSVLYDYYNPDARVSIRPARFVVR